MLAHLEIEVSPPRDNVCLLLCFFHVSCVLCALFMRATHAGRYKSRHKFGADPRPPKDGLRPAIVGKQGLVECDTGDTGELTHF